MSTKLFTSDLHFGHEKVATLRGFSSVGEHDEHILQTLHEHVGPEDDLFILGDLVGRPDAWYDALNGIFSLPGRTHHLILGNHDPAHPASSTKSGIYLRQALDVFDTVAPFGRVKIGKGRHAMLSHFPYTRERNGAPPRWREWRLADVGLPLIHGHLHESHKGYGREVHIGWDAWGQPVPLDVVRSILDDRGVLV